MKFIVELLAFGKPGAVREVNVLRLVPDDHPITHPESACDAVFWWGQNENQPQDKPSVSVGDVIALSNTEKYLIMAERFRKLDKFEYADYLQLPQDQRVLYAYKLSLS